MNIDPNLLPRLRYRSSEESTHLGLSNGSDVKYAGSIRFTDNQGVSRGQIKEWDNKSGHYKPSINNASQSGLPLDKLK